MFQAPLRVVCLLQALVNFFDEEVRGMKPAARSIVQRLEQALFRGGWPFALARGMGIRPSVEVARHHLQVGGLDAPLMKIVCASDLHAGPTTDPGLLRAACRQMRAEAPDLLLLGGDFVTFAREDVDWLAGELGEIPAPLGRFAVLGNHDWAADARYIAGRLEAAGIEVLTNRNVRLPSPYDGVWICGLDDHCHGQPDATAAVAGADGVRIVLMHSPSGLLDLREERFDLALCGHTHGGQIALPGGIPIIVPSGALSRRYARGRFQLPGARTLLVSVGLGSVILPFRLFARPEIMVCTLTPRVLAGADSSRGEESSPASRTSRREKAVGGQPQSPAFVDG